MANRDPGDVTHLLRRWKEGDSAAEGPLFDALYEHLRRIADGLMSSERPDHTLQATELVHEAFLRIGPESADWDDRVHFFAVAARSMRRVLVDHARARATA